MNVQDVNNWYLIILHRIFVAGKIFTILVNYNNHDDTLKCLGSITEAGYGRNVIVVDNKSTVPGTDEIKKIYPDTVVIKNEENVGFGRANNIGIDWALKNTECEYIFILNNDTSINKTTIPLLQKAFAGNKKIAIAVPKIVMMDDPELLWYGGGEIDWKKCSAKVPGYLGVATGKLACTSRFVTFASGCAMLIRRKVIEDIGGFDQRFFMYLEDLELCLRIVKNGLRILYVPDAVVYHKGQGSQRGKQKFYPIDHAKNPKLPFYVYHLTKNRLLTIRQHASGMNAMKFWSFFPFFMMIRSMQYLIHGRLEAVDAIRKGLLDSFKD